MLFEERERFQAERKKERFQWTRASSAKWEEQSVSLSHVPVINTPYSFYGILSR